MFLCLKHGIIVNGSLTSRSQLYLAKHLKVVLLRMLELNSEVDCKEVVLPSKSWAVHVNLRQQPCLYCLYILCIHLKYSHTPLREIVTNHVHHFSERIKTRKECSVDRERDQRTVSQVQGTVSQSTNPAGTGSSSQNMRWEGKIWSVATSKLKPIRNFIVSKYACNQKSL